MNIWEWQQYADLACSWAAAFAMTSIGIFLLHLVLK